MSEVARVRLEEDGRESDFVVRLLHEFGNFNGKLKSKKDVARKISDLWVEAKEYDVLFSDYTQGDPQAFIDIFLDPTGVWFEVERELDHRILGALYMTDITPQIDAEGHFTFWDSRGSGREPIIWAAMDWAFERYGLHRMTAKVPPYQSGVIRFIKRLGFKEEGKTREAFKHKGDWMPLIQFGILKEEFEEVQDG